MCLAVYAKVVQEVEDHGACEWGSCHRTPSGGEVGGKRAVTTPFEVGLNGTAQKDPNGTADTGGCLLQVFHSQAFLAGLAPARSLPSGAQVREPAASRSFS